MENGSKARSEPTVDADRNGHQPLSARLMVEVQ
jgi:hypothetical protein